MREFGNRQYNVFDYGRHGREHHRIASGNDHFLDFSHGDDQRLADGGRRVDLYGNDNWRMRRGHSYWRDHGNSVQYVGADFSGNDYNAGGML
jgi:hypothetical protein